MKFFALPSPREIMIKQQTEAMRDMLDHQRSAEYHAAMVKMLDKRVQRLQKQIDGGANSLDTESMS
jgi:hypothetical protein